MKLEEVPRWRINENLTMNNSGKKYKSKYEEMRAKFFEEQKKREAQTKIDNEKKMSAKARIDEVKQ